MSHLFTGKRGALAPPGRRVAAAFAAATLSAALVAPLAGADTLSDLRSAARITQEKQAEARGRVSQSEGVVNSATARLADSQNQLAHAQAVLGDISVQLSAARENDARIAAELASARAELEAAKERVARADAEVAAQVHLIGQAARESFQQQTDLRGLTVVFGSESPAELSQRLQWNTTIFDTQAAEKSRLDAVLAELEAARQAQAELEQRVAREKQESARAVARIAQLERQAAEQRAAVAALVSSNEQARAAAQSELASDEAEFRSLQADESRLQTQIQSELARLKAEEEARRRAEEEARRRAEEARRQAEEEARRKAAEAARLKAEAEVAAQARARDAAEKKRQADAAAAAAARAATKAVAATAPAKQASGPSGPTVSAWGFIHPVDARYGSAFGLRFHPILKYWRSHNGVDMGAPTGTPIYAAASGTVLQAGPNGGFGNFVLIGHGDLIDGKYVTTGYAHQSRIVVKKGQRVQRGQLIGYVGSTGLSTTPHLHFELRLDGTPVNPVRYVP